MFVGFNSYADLDDLVFANAKYEHKVVLLKQIENANTWQTGLINFIRKVQRFFEVRRLNQWRTLSIS